MHGRITDHVAFKKHVVDLKGQWILTLNGSMKGMLAGFNVEEFDLAIRMDKKSRSEYVPDIIVKSPNLKPGRHGFSMFTDFF